MAASSSGAVATRLPRTAAGLGGTCTIERGAGGGTRVRARIPVPEE
jgi:hypothetical protein